MSQSPKYSPGKHANICLLLEGTYPYVRGGVSSWVKQLIEGMPDLKFSIVFLGGSASEYDKPAYEIPANVVHIENHYLIGSDKEAPAKKKFWARKSDKTAIFYRNTELHETLAESNGPLGREVIRDFTNMLCGENAITRTDLNHSDEAWEAIREKYIDAPPGLDFNHFFWTVRTMHSPLFTLANIAKNAPPADVYHSVSTGYAGYLGAMLKARTGAPYIISEHGIYTKEREIDLAHVDWIPEELDPFRVGLDDSMGYLRQTWIRFFQSLGRMSYSNADHVYTLFNGNRLRQIDDGADESRLTIIPNGVNVQNLRTCRRADDAAIPPVVALIGRIVPIKDIKTFIRAMRIVVAKVPEAEGWLIGPENEDPDYAEECKALLKSFGLDDSVKFLGFQKVGELLPKIGVTALTSVSEGQPLVTLEGFAAGIPAVTTDVGSCSELIHGVTDDDRAIGSAGGVVPIANPALFADEVIKLLDDEDNWRRASRAAVTRVEKYYDEKDMLIRYRDIYDDNIDQSRRSTMPKAEGF
jgi:glycosyltransferase involved in cell wall biosynthesis